MGNKSDEKRLQQGVRVTFKKNELSLLNHLEKAEEGCSVYIKKLIKADMERKETEDSKDPIINMTVSEFIAAIRTASSGKEFKISEASIHSVDPLPVTEEIHTYEKPNENKDETNSDSNQKEVSDKNDMASDIEETEDVPVLKEEDTEVENTEDGSKESSYTVSTVKPSKNFSIQDLNF